MKVDFDIGADSYSEYCPSCKSKNSCSIINGSSKRFACDNCGARNERLLIIDNGLDWWIDDNKNYCHRSVGILLSNPDNEILFFKLNKFPFGLTIPAGHVDYDESPKEAIIRETKEEVNLDIRNPKLIKEVMIEGDSCRQGSDLHYWHVFTKEVEKTCTDALEIDSSEGLDPVWLSFKDIKGELENMPKAMKFIFGKYGSDVKRLLSTASTSSN